MRTRIRKLLPEELDRVKPLFDGWEDTMIWSCLQGMMGSVYVTDVEHPASAAALLNDFCFLAGEPAAELITFDYGRDLILTPQNEAWVKLMEAICGDRVVRQIRYAIKKEPGCFDERKLRRFLELPEGYVLRQIEESLYAQCMQEDWSRDLVSPYPTYAEFERLGLGFVVTHDGNVVSGASSYSRYLGGIEIEINTKTEHRRRGLATAAASALILACLQSGWYPSWDAQNMASLALAEKLGYHFSHEYPVYIKCRTE